MNVIDLFAGIGGFSLGLERSGAFRTVAFCEINPYCRRVLAKHWPGVPIYDDVATLTAAQLDADGIAVDVITAGFPCQDISVAGRYAGLDAARSGLWRHVTRLAGELRPRYVIMENVPALLVRGLGTILADLAALGLDAEWHCIPAAAIGAPHRRDRIWIVAHAGRQRDDGRCSERGGPETPRACDWPARSGQHACDVAYPKRGDIPTGREARDLAGEAGEAEGEGLQRQRLRHAAGHGGAVVANADSERAEHQQPAGGDADTSQWHLPCGRSEAVADANRRDEETRQRLQRSDDGSPGMPEPRRTPAAHVANTSEHRLERTFQRQLHGLAAGTLQPPLGRYADWWSTEPNVGRVAHGVPARVDRLRALGNAIVPQIAELIGHAIAAAEAQS